MLNEKETQLIFGNLLEKISDLNSLNEIMGENDPVKLVQQDRLSHEEVNKVLGDPTASQRDKNEARSRLTRSNAAIARMRAQNARNDLEKTAGGMVNQRY